MTPSDRALVMTKHHANRLSFGVLLAFFRDHGRFPRIAAEVDRPVVEEVARQLAIGVPGDFSLKLSERTAERHRAEIRLETDRLGWSFIIHRTDRPASELLLKLHEQLGSGRDGTGINRWHAIGHPERRA